MRIKIDDKIYRLKEIESGVDSLMELVEEQKYKNGDFVYENERIMIVKSYPNFHHVNIWHTRSDKLSYNRTYAVNFSEPTFRYATEEEKQILIDAMKKDGKRWNAEKKCVEDIPVYKDGDFVVNDLNAILILNEAIGDLVFDHAYLPAYGELIIDKVAGCGGIKRHATTEEKQRMIEALAERGKRWNKDKKCIEDIPNRKFKAGDKVKIKAGISSETHRYVSPNFTEPMDEFIGKELTVKEYSSSGFVVFFGDYFEFHFHENWLEPWNDEPKVGDWVVFWDHSPKAAKVGVLTGIRSDSWYKYRIDGGACFQHAVKWDGTKEHLEKVRKGW